jgi:hypothetical protein
MYSLPVEDKDLSVCQPIVMSVVVGDPFGSFLIKTDTSLLSLLERSFGMIARCFVTLLLKVKISI